MSIKDRLGQQAEEAGDYPDHPIVKWEVGTVVAGTVDAVRRGPDDVLVLDVDDEDVGMVTVFCGATRLRAHFEAQPPQPGDVVYIECYDEDWEVARGGNAMKLFRVAVERSNRRPPHRRTRDVPKRQAKPKAAATAKPPKDANDDVPF